MAANLKSWRESASLILIAKSAFSPHKHDFNYKLLTIKRSSRSSVLPGTYVFPGGLTTNADSSRDWLKLYENFGFGQDTFEKLNPKENRPAIFNTDSQSEIPKFLSLRISAIRETFEECGILLCRSFKINYKERPARWASFIGGFEITKWQEKVQADPNEFINLCSNLEVYPDVWSLKEWSNWATPVTLKNKFDTAFFVAAFHQMPPAHAEKKEVHYIEWATPADYVYQNRYGRIILSPPQFYEISRLGNFFDIERLAQFAADRAAHGSERYFVHCIRTEEGLYYIFPGDDLYPKNMDPANEELPFVEQLPDSKVKNRLLYKTPFNIRITTSNFDPTCNHVVPVDFKDIF